MDIFLRDPIVDWVESCARKRPSSSDANDDDGDDDDDDDEMGGKSSHKRSSSSKPVWEPARRIRNARRKLSGANPVDVLLDDLKQNPTVNALKSLPALEAILKGQAASSGGSGATSASSGGGGGGSKSGKAPARATNARLQDATQSAADQVACLVDMAADPNLLGRQWIGLASWM